MPDLDRITIVIETLPGQRAQVKVNIPTPTPGMRLGTPAHALAIDALGWLGKQPAVAGFVYSPDTCRPGSPPPAASRDSHFFLAGWNGAVLNVVADDHFRKAEESAPQLAKSTTLGGTA